MSGTADMWKNKSHVSVLMNPYPLSVSILIVLSDMFVTFERRELRPSTDQPLNIPSESSKLNEGARRVHMQYLAAR